MLHQTVARSCAWDFRVVDAQGHRRKVARACSSSSQTLFQSGRRVMFDSVRTGQDVVLRGTFQKEAVYFRCSFIFHHLNPTHWQRSALGLHPLARHVCKKTSRAGHRHPYPAHHSFCNLEHPWCRRLIPRGWLNDCSRKLRAVHGRWLVTERKGNNMRKAVLSHCPSRWISYSLSRFFVGDSLTR